MTTKNKGLDGFTTSYCETALSASEDLETGRPMDEDFTVVDINPKTLDEMKMDCAKFYKEISNVLHEMNGFGVSTEWESIEETAGRAFWLTRHKKVGGFEVWPENWKDQLLAAAKLYRETPLVVVDGQVEFY